MPCSRSSTPARASARGTRPGVRPVSPPIGFGRERLGADDRARPCGDAGGSVEVESEACQAAGRRSGPAAEAALGVGSRGAVTNPKRSWGDHPRMQSRAPLRALVAAVVWLVPTVDIAALVLLGWLAPRAPDPVFFATFALWIASLADAGGLIAIRVSGNPVGGFCGPRVRSSRSASAGATTRGSASSTSGRRFLWRCRWPGSPAGPCRRDRTDAGVRAAPLSNWPTSSRRWRIVAGFGVVAIISAASIAFRPGPLSNVHSIENPLAVPALAP